MSPHFASAGVLPVRDAAGSTGRTDESDTTARGGAPTP
ncbi:hypothetical protein Ae150APs1_2314c [Pseudonocardia sp. Ae150A_Ps1]|nr:hypothetical protein Ae150APs1_2314c [Pseudonocardia sp. Ae150A_Ps1]